MDFLKKLFGGMKSGEKSEAMPAAEMSAKPELESTEATEMEVEKEEGDTSMEQ